MKGETQSLFPSAADWAEHSPRLLSRRRIHRLSRRPFHSPTIVLLCDRINGGGGGVEIHSLRKESDCEATAKAAANQFSPSLAADAAAETAFNSFGGVDGDRLADH